MTLLFNNLMSCVCVIQLVAIYVFLFFGFCIFSGTFAMYVHCTSECKLCSFYWMGPIPAHRLCIDLKWNKRGKILILILQCFEIVKLILNTEATLKIPKNRHRPITSLECVGIGFPGEEVKPQEHGILLHIFHSVEQ